MQTVLSGESGLLCLPTPPQICAWNVGTGKEHELGSQRDGAHGLAFLISTPVWLWQQLFHFSEFLHL